MPLIIVNPFPYDHSSAFPDTVERASNKPPLVHNSGFDVSTKFKLLQSPVGRTQFSVAGGSPKGLHFEVRPAGVCSILSQDIDLKLPKTIGLVTVEGSAPGECQLVLADAKGKAVDQITIKVAAHRVVKVRYYNMVGTGGGSAIRDPGTNPRFSQTALSDLVHEVNNIVGLQCATFLELVGQGIRDVTVPFGVGKDVLLTRDRSQILGSSDIDRSAEYHVVFVVSLDSNDRGQTSANLTVLRQLGSERPLTAAHEFVHFLCDPGTGITKGDHDKSRSDLMFTPPPHGLEMRKDRLLKAIRVRPTP